MVICYLFTRKDLRRSILTGKYSLHSRPVEQTFWPRPYLLIALLTFQKHNFPQFT